MAASLASLRRVLAPLLARLGEWGPFVLFTVVWIAIVLVPMAGIFVFSLVKMRGVQIDWTFSLDAYADIIQSGRWEVLVRTVSMAAAVTAICALVGIPFAIWMAKARKPRWLDQLVWMALTVPFFLDPSARTLVWRAVLGNSGAINTALLKLGLVDAPLDWLLFSDFAVGFGLVGSYFPNMVWPVFLAVVLVDGDLVAAARDLGAAPTAVLRTVMLPLALPGIIAGVIFTFVPILGDNVTTNLLGGGKKEYLADSVTSLSTTMNYAGASAFSAFVLVLGALVALAPLAIGRLARRGSAA